MEETTFGVIACCLLGLIFMLLFSGERHTRRTHKEEKECDHDWRYDGENGSTTGAFYYCKKCGKNKYIPYKELMAMSEEDYKFWTTRKPSMEEKNRQLIKKANYNKK